MVYQKYMRGMANATQSRTSHALSNKDLMQLAPSIFAEEAHSARSERYAYLPTVEVVDALRIEGFHPFFVAQSKSRDESRTGFTKHMLRFRHESNFLAPAGEFNEVVLVNSHDGTSSYQMMGGRFRMVCSNGLIAGDVLTDIKLPHRGTSVGDIIEGAFAVLNEFEVIDNDVAEMGAIQLSLPEQRILGMNMLGLKFEETDFRPSSQDIIMPRRSEDTASDLWTTFNRIQENIIRGGIPKTVNPPADGRRGTTRAINGIGENTKLNRSMWNLAEQMRMLKCGIDLEDLL